MFTGITNQSLDSKGRVILSPAFRDGLGESFYITNGFNRKFRCVQIMDEKQFENIRDQIRNMPADKALQFQYFFIAPASKTSANAQGRVQIPQAIRELSKLQKDIVVLGMDNRIEVWDKTTYEQFMAESMEESFAEALELLRLY